MASAADPSAEIDLPVDGTALLADAAASAGSPSTLAVESGSSGDRLAELERRIAELEQSMILQPPAPEAPETPPPAAKPDPNAMKVGWGKNGFEAASANKDFVFHAGGRVQVDAVAMQDSNLVLSGIGTDDAVNFRRARFRMDGTMYKRMTWATEFDWVNDIDTDPTNGATPVFANGGDVAPVPAITDMWLAFGEVPWVGNVKVGSQKPPIGLEHLNSSRFLDFMERSFLQDAYFGPFTNGFTPGVSVYNWNEDETATYALGAYKHNQNIFGYDTGDNEYMLIGRLTAVPWAANDDAQLLHVGCAASFQGLDQDASPAVGNVRIRSRASLRNGPPSALNPNLADTNFSGRLFADNQTLIAPEIALVDGPWLWQAEYVAGYINGTTLTPNVGAPIHLGQVFTQGHYVQVLYFLTGEHRAYERHEARFGRVVPNNNLLWNPCGVCDLGAWQVGARYGFLDLNDGPLGGGYIQDLTIGLNWFLNPFSKIQFNYVHQHVNSSGRLNGVDFANDGNLDGFGVRCAYDF
jgi:phosphate-selective porin OprO/OprP